jgi:hypothetical protein
MIRIVCALSLFLSLAFAGCTQNQTASVQKNAAAFGTDVKNFATSPTGQALIQGLIGAAANAAVSYGTTGQLNSSQLVAAAMDGSASMLRTLGTNNVSIASVTNSINQGSGAPVVSAKVAPLVAQNIQAQIKSGTKPTQATANAAAILNSVAAKTAK